MSDLISREALLKEFSGDKFLLGYIVREVIKNAPAVDAEPVRHSYWEYDPNGVDWGIGAFRCHDCGAVNENCGHDNRYNPTIFVGTKYCPNCGTQMDLEVDG